MLTFVLVLLLLSIKTNAQGLLATTTTLTITSESNTPISTLSTIFSSSSTSSFTSTTTSSTSSPSTISLTSSGLAVTSRLVTTIVTIVGPSSSTSSSQPTQSAPQQSGNGLSMGAIIGLSMAGGVVVIGLIAFFIWKLTRQHSSDFDNREVKKGPDLNTHGGVIASEMSNTVPSPNVVNPFTVPPSNSSSTFLHQNYPSNGQSFSSLSIPSKFSHGNQPSEPASSNGGIPPLTQLRPQFLSPASISSSSSHRPPLSGSQANPDSRVTQPTTEPSIQRSPSPQGAAARFGFVRHEDSGVRIPLARDNFVELPPLYTPG